MPQNSAAVRTPSTERRAGEHHQIIEPKGDTRNVWVLTGYTASLLGLLGVLAYYASEYFTH